MRPRVAVAVALAVLASRAAARTEDALSDDDKPNTQQAEDLAKTTADTLGGESVASSLNWTAAHARVRAVLNQSATAYASGDPERALKAAFKLKKKSVWLIDGKFYVDKSFLGEMKHELHLRFVRAVADHARTVADRSAAKASDDAESSKSPPQQHHEVTRLQRAAVLFRRGTFLYRYESMASGPSECDADLPTLVIAKKHTAQCGVMIPNPYFDTIYDAWKHDFDQLLGLGWAAKVAKAWDKRNPRVFWRGKIRQEHGPEECDRDAGNFARVSASALTLTHPAQFDVRPVDCAVRKPSKACDRVFGVRAAELRAQASKCRAVVGKFVTHTTFAGYRGVLDLPGSTSGSYSRNLNHLWLLGAVVFIWTGPLLDGAGASQWYTPALVDSETHVVVDRDTAPALAKAALADDVELRERLRAAARGVAERLLCADCLVRYVLEVVHAVAVSTLDLVRLLNEPEDNDAESSTSSSIARRRKAVLSEARCDKMNWVQVVGNRAPNAGKHHVPNWKVATRPVAASVVCKMLANPRAGSGGFLDAKKWEPAPKVLKRKPPKLTTNATGHDRRRRRRLWSSSSSSSSLWY